MEIKQIMVAGAGQMGSGIAQTAAGAGFYVRMYDVNPEAAEAGLKRLKKQLARDAEKGKRTETE
ncbi:3-hydroxyacyl-CoA dehydrogenase NAD-binding domain-containing protein, partial [Bacillus sp. LR--39]